MKKKKVNVSEPGISGGTRRIPRLFTVFFILKIQKPKKNSKKNPCVTTLYSLKLLHRFGIPNKIQSRIILRLSKWTQCFLQ